MAVIRSIPSIRVINGVQIRTSEIALVSESFYETKGESVLVVRKTPFCKIKLDSKTTDHITIKAMTNVLIIPDINKIDEDWDEISISKGACVEFRYAGENWYIMSSDGMKIGE